MKQDGGPGIYNLSSPATRAPKKYWCELQLCVAARSMGCDARNMGSAASPRGQKDLPYLFLITGPWQAMNLYEPWLLHLLNGGVTILPVL